MTRREAWWQPTTLFCPQRNLKLLNLNYDLIPADLVTVVATEAGLVPPSSVPVILREYRKDLHADFGVA